MTTTSITDPTAAASSGAATVANSNSDITKDEFLQLLTYQLKSQDPLNPMDNQQFAAQLAQFSQLEQLTDINSLMGQQVQATTALSQTISNSALPGLIGKTAKALSDKVYFNGSSSSSLGYTLPSSATSGYIVIKDSSGNVVNKFELYEMDLTKGDHDLTWNGQDSNGKTLPTGEYTFGVDSTDASGASVTADTYTYGQIQAVRFKSEGTVLVVNGVEVPLADISDIST